MNGLSALAFAVVIALASYRTWALIALDEITAPLRRPLARRDNWLYRFVRCPWCLGFWITVGATALTDALVADGIPAPVLVGAAAAAGTALLGQRDERLMTAEYETE